MVEGSQQLVPGRSDITLEGWQKEPQLHWAFQHIAEIFPTAPIAPADAASSLPRSDVDLLGLTVVHPLTGATLTVREVLDETNTDGWIVVRNGRICQEVYPCGMEPSTRHLLMSVSKSLVGAVAAALQDKGLLDPGQQVARYVPELVGTGYEGATVRHLLDMRSGIEFSEEYLNPTAEVRLLEQAIGWAPRERQDLPDTLYGYLRTLTCSREHGGPFEYRSCETDVLGWVCERAGGAMMAELISDLVWRPMGAEFAADLAVDRCGAGLHDGGVSAALRDLVRFGSIFLADGTASNGARILSPARIEETLTGDPDTSAAFAASKDGGWMPGGMYRNQLWFPSARRDVLLCLGIHGQMIYINRAAGVVGAKLSSWPTPQDSQKLYGTLAAFDAVAAQLSGNDATG